MKYLLALSLVFLIVYLIIPCLKILSLKWDFVDKPTERKKHQKPIPLLGGIGIFLGFICGYVAFVRPIDNKSVFFITASVLVLLIGVLDDWYKTLGKEFSAFPRLMVHIIAAIIVYSSGTVFYGFTNPVTHQYIILPSAMQFILSIMWIVAMINFCSLSLRFTYYCY